MGISEWLLRWLNKPAPSSATRPTPARDQDSDGEHGYDFRNSERPADHVWRWHLNDIGGQRVALGIAGAILPDQGFCLAFIDRQVDDITKFLEAAYVAEASGRRYGILLERETSNQDDAVRVIGWIDEPSRSVFLGYLHREESAGIAKGFPADMPIAAGLWRVYLSEASKLWVGIRLLSGLN